MDYSKNESLKQLRRELCNQYKAGDFSSCIRGYNELLKQSWNDDQVHELQRDLAQCYYATQKYSSAIDLINKVLDADDLDDKSYIIGLKAAVACSSWSKFADYFARSFSAGCVSEKLLQIFMEVEDKIPERQKQFIFSRIPPFYRSNWPTCGAVEARAVQKEDTKPGGNFVKTPSASVTNIKPPLKLTKKKTPQPCLIPETADAVMALKNSRTNVSRDEIESSNYTTSKANLQLQETYKSICKEAAGAHQNGWNVLQLYQRAYKLSQDLLASTFIISETDIILIRFLTCQAQLETVEYRNIHDAIITLKTIVEKHARFLPALYVSLARAFTSLNRFEIAKEWVVKGQDFIDKGIRFSKQTYPETNVTIKLTTRETIIVDLKKLASICGQFHPPDAVCRYEACEQHNTYHIAPSKDIYFSDPDFDGYVMLECTEKCDLRFHRSCWKSWKTDKVLSALKMSDDQYLGATCSTPDCSGVVLRLKLVEKDGQVKTVRDGEKNIAVQKDDTKRIRRDSTKKNSTTVNIHQHSDSSSVPSSPRKSNISQTCADILMPPPQIPPLRPMAVFPDSKSPEFQKPFMKDKKMQTEQLEVFEKFTQTAVTVDLNQQRLRDAETQIVNLTKKYDKLRDKYMVLKNNEDKHVELIQEVRTQERTKAVLIWKEASDKLINNWQFYCNEKCKILLFVRDNFSSGVVTPSLDKLLTDWGNAQSEINIIKEEFQRETMISAAAHVSLELPQLPNYPEDIFPTISIVETVFSKLQNGGHELDLPSSVDEPNSDCPIRPISEGATSFNNNALLVDPSVIASSQAANPIEASSEQFAAQYLRSYPFYTSSNLHSLSVLPQESTEVVDSSYIPVNYSITNPHESYEPPDTEIPILPQQISYLTPDHISDILKQSFSEDEDNELVAEGIDKDQEENIYEAKCDEINNVVPSINCDGGDDCNSEINNTDTSSMIPSKIDEGTDEWESASENETETDSDENEASYTAPVNNRFRFLAEGGDKISKAALISKSNNKKVTTNKHVGLKSAPNSPAKLPVAGARLRTESLRSVRSLDLDLHRPVANALVQVIPPAQQWSTVPIYTRLMNYLFTRKEFCANSEEEIRRCLEALRQEDRLVFKTKSLPDIVTLLKAKILKNEGRRVALHKFTDKAWVALSPPARNPLKANSTKSLGECPICFDSLAGLVNNMTLKCSHVFHTQCLRKWLKTDHTCPLCREYVITQEEFPALT